MIIQSLCLVVVVTLLGLGPDHCLMASATTVWDRMLRIGAFNINRFGRAKMSRPRVSELITEIVGRYDVLLIQEIRDKSVEAVRQLRDMLGRDYAFVISEPIGRTRYKEQYAFFYRNDRLYVWGTFQYEDPQDFFEREPFVVKLAPQFDRYNAVSLIGLHTRPSDATAEIGHLGDVINRTLLVFDNTEPIILGDLNADCSHANRDKRMAANDYLTTSTNTYTWLIDDHADTTSRTSTNCSYDRIIVRKQLETRVVRRSAGVFDFREWWALSEEQTLNVSDHYPVEMVLRF